MIPWSFEGKAVSSHPEGAKAFVYRLEFANGDYYHGKKNLESVRRKKLVGKTRRVTTISESNWKSYLSSSTEVKARLKAGDKLTKREILRWCYSTSEATYFELWYQMVNHVLLDIKSLNKWVSAKIYRPKEPYDNLDL